MPTERPSDEDVRDPNETPPLLYLGQEGDETSPRTLVKTVLLTPDREDIDRIRYEAMQPQGTIGDGDGYRRDVIGFAEFPRHQPVPSSTDFEEFRDYVNAKSVHVYWKPGPDLDIEHVGVADDHGPEVRTDGGEDGLPEFDDLNHGADGEDDPSTLPCWDCEKEITQREAAWAEVIDHDTVDGMGYETYDAPLCHHCYRKRLPSHECGTCGREYPDLEMAATCCPDGVMEGPI